MRQPDEKGLTIIELLISFTIMGIIAVVATPLFSTCLDTYRGAYARSMLYHEGLLAMERMTDGVRRCTYLLTPNSHAPTRNILAISGFFNDDNDYYFDNDNDFNYLLFPRIDEDVSGDMNYDFVSGIAGIDDDGNGSVDEGSRLDDDEDGLINEDPLNPLIYSFDSSTNTLLERFPDTGESVDLSTHVTSFQVTYIYDAPDPENIIILILIELTLTGDDGEVVMFSEYVYPRNTLQKTGKRVL